MGRDSDGRTSRAGGLGVHTGDEGSAADIGKKAALAAKLHHQQTGEDTPLGNQLLRQLGHASWKEFRKDNLDSFRASFPWSPMPPTPATPQLASYCPTRRMIWPYWLSKSRMTLSLRELPFHLAKMGGMIGRCAFFDRELDSRIYAPPPLKR